jgi:NAD(P)-dependent dehydrogenase (short-subunit alcohol dehydrogenase family)
MPEPKPDPPAAPPISSPPRFQDRVCVISGGARAMGRAHALALAAEGCDLVLGDIVEDLPDGTPYPKATSADLEETARQVEAKGRRCIAAKMDVRDPSQAAELVNRAVKEFGRLDFLIANAALTIEAPLAEIAPEDFDRVVRTNLYGAFHVLSPALRVMIKQERGRVVLIGSGGGGPAQAKPHTLINK